MSFITIYTLMEIVHTAEKGIVILTSIFLIRITTVDMVLWNDTRVVPHIKISIPCNSDNEGNR